MIRSKNIVRQSVSGVVFGTDCRTGRIEYASIGGEDMPKIDVYQDSKLHNLVVWVLCVVGRVYEVFGLKSDNRHNEEIARVLESHVRIAAASLGMFSERKNFNPFHFVADCISSCWLDLHKYDPSKSEFGTWVFWRVRLQKARWLRQRQRGNREKDLDILLKSVKKADSTFDSDENIRTKEFRSFQELRDSLIKDEYVRCESVDHKLRLDKLAAKFDVKDWEVLKMYFVKGMTLKDIGEKTSMTSMGVQKKLLRLINGLRPKDQPILSLGGKKQRTNLFLKLAVKEYPPQEEGVLRVVDNPPSGYRHNGHQVYMPDRPNERLQLSLSNGLSPRFSDYVRKVKGEGFTMLVAD